jgi:Lon protease-like protein
LTPRFEDLPAEFPIFPLPAALLLPGGKLPLNIFEPRYLAMTEDCLASGRALGVIQPDPAAPAADTGPGLYRVGCLGRISAFSETDDGRFLITLTGVIRFAVKEELASRRGYRRIRGELAPYRTDLDLSGELNEFDRSAFMRALRAYFARSGLEANWATLERLPDAMLIITLSMLCPFEPVEKQALLEAETEADRARVLLALLQMGGAGHHLAAS